MFFNAIKWLRTIFGCILLLFGILGVGLGILDIIDPVGTKMADDGDPFGTPHTLAEGLFITAAYVLVLLLGLWLIFGFDKRKFR